MLLLFLIVGYIVTEFFDRQVVYSGAIVPSLFILQSYGVYMIYHYAKKIFLKNKKSCVKVDQ